MQQQIIEISTFNKDDNVQTSIISHVEWRGTIKQGVEIFNGIFNRTQYHLKFKLWNFIPYIMMRLKYNKYRSSANQIITNSRVV